VGFAIPDHFVLGYGFDLGGLYRGLPDIHILEETERAART
jgi:hypoxanthine-guanine phosphoribosyltransferase